MINGMSKTIIKSCVARPASPNACRHAILANSIYSKPSRLRRHRSEQMSSTRTLNRNRLANYVATFTFKNGSPRSCLRLLQCCSSLSPPLPARGSMRLSAAALSSRKTAGQDTRQGRVGRVKPAPDYKFIAGTILLGIEERGVDVDVGSLRAEKCAQPRLVVRGRFDLIRNINAQRCIGARVCHYHPSSLRPLHP